MPAVGKVKLVLAVAALPTGVLLASANVHAKVLMSPVEVLVKFTVKGAVPALVSMVKLATGATGAALTVMVCGAEVSLPPKPSTLSVALYVPAAGKVKLVAGELAVPMGVLLASVNVHVSVLKSPVEVLVKVTVRGALPLDLSIVKLATGATGAALTVMVWGAEVLVPALFDTVSLAAYEPAFA